MNELIIAVIILTISINIIIIRVSSLQIIVLQVMTCPFKEEKVVKLDNLFKPTETVIDWFIIIITDITAIIAIVIIYFITVRN